MLNFLRLNYTHSIVTTTCHFLVNKMTNIVVPKSIHIGGAIVLAIWHHKKLLYLFCLLTLQNIQHQWIYFSFQHNKII